MSDHDYIWLAPACTHDQNGERLWCEDDVWDEPSCCRGQCDNKCSATEYIRMDLHLRALGADAVTIERQAAEIERIRSALERVRVGTLDLSDHFERYEFDAFAAETICSIHDEAEAALSIKVGES